MAKELYCNVCGKRMGLSDYFGYVSISRTLGYGSQYDGDYIDVDICPGCFDSILEEMVLNPFSETPEENQLKSGNKNGGENE